MKKTALVLAIGAASIMPLAAVADGPIDGKVYGKVNVSLVNADNGVDDQWELDSNASRLGFEGKTQLSEGLYAIYKLEYEVSVDGDGDTFGKRNIIAGLQGGFGTVWAGRHDTPTKLAQNKIDLFNDLQGDIKNTFEGENRVNNIVAYTTPSMSGFSAMVAFVPGENNDTEDSKFIGEADTTNDGLADGVSYLISYDTESLYLAIAGDQDIDNQDLIRAVAQWTIDALQLGFMYQQNESNLDSASYDESGYFVSAAYKIDAVTLKAQYGMVEDDADDDEEDTWSLGADYKLAKSTKLFAFYTANEDTPGGDSSSIEEDYFGVGLEHKF